MARYNVRYRGHHLIGGYKWRETNEARWFISAFVSAALLHFQGWQQVEIMKKGKKKDGTN